jgi:hypothetical protein
MIALRRSSGRPAIAESIVSPICRDCIKDLRSAIMLSEIEGLSYEEIAEAMKCPIGTVRSRIFRAREVVADKLRPLLDTAADRRW